MEADETQVPKPRRGAILFLIGFAVLACVVSLLPSLGSVTKVSLKDDSILSFEKLTYGTNHVFHPDPAWKRFLRRYVGWSGFGIVGKERTKRTSRPMPVVWLQVKRPESQNQLAWGSYVITTETGQEISVMSSHSSSDHHDVRAVYLWNATRRERFFQISPDDNSHPLPTLRIPNPQYGQSWPEWKPDPLPITNTVGNLAFVLRDAKLSRHRNRVYFQPQLEIYHQGQRHDDWYAHFHQLTDATGNQWHMIPTNQPAWRVEMNLTKTQKARNWETNEFASFTLKGIPKPGEVKRLRIGRTLGGSHTEELWVGGPGEYFLRQLGVQAARTNFPTRKLHVEYSEPFGGDWATVVESEKPWIGLLRETTSAQPELTVLAVRDKAGKLVETNHEFNYVGTRREWCSYEIEDANVTGPFTLDIYVPKPIEINYKIDPGKLRRVDEDPSTIPVPHVSGW